MKGHQIIGELRLKNEKNLFWVEKLKGHQIIGELRLYARRPKMQL